MQEYITKHNNLAVNCLTKEQHKRTCGYWYTVFAEGSPHTAFAHDWVLYRWLWERGLRLTVPLPEKRGTHDYIGIEGTYLESVVICEPEEWTAISPILGRGIGLSNGDYVEVIFSAEPDGTVRERKLNPNCLWRKTFDYLEQDERRK